MKIQLSAMLSNEKWPGNNKFSLGNVRASKIRLLKTISFEGFSSGDVLEHSAYCRTTVLLSRSGTCSDSQILLKAGGKVGKLSCWRGKK